MKRGTEFLSSVIFAKNKISVAAWLGVADLRSVILLLLLFLLWLCAVGCSSGRSTSSIPAVAPFEAERYLGKWYEIARLPHSFEKNLYNCYAVYSTDPDEEGGILVENVGLRSSDHSEKRVHGFARSAGEPAIGELEVTFFPPFYGAYRILYLDENYTVAIVTSATTDYLWLLARERCLPPEQQEMLIRQCASWGFSVEQLVFPQTEEPGKP